MLIFGAVGKIRICKKKKKASAFIYERPLCDSRYVFLSSHWGRYLHSVKLPSLSLLIYSKMCPFTTQTYALAKLKISPN